jgi:hypothetical protein
MIWPIVPAFTALLTPKKKKKDCVRESGLLENSSGGVKTDGCYEKQLC